MSLKMHCKAVLLPPYNQQDLTRLLASYRSHLQGQTRRAGMAAVEVKVSTEDNDNSKTNVLHHEILFVCLLKLTIVPVGSVKALREDPGENVDDDDSSEDEHR